MADKLKQIIDSLKNMAENPNLDLTEHLIDAVKQYTPTTEEKYTTAPVEFQPLFSSVPDDPIMKVDDSEYTEDQLVSLVLDTPNELSNEQVAKVLEHTKSIVFVPTNYTSIKEILDKHRPHADNSAQGNKRLPNFLPFYDVRYTFWMPSVEKSSFFAKLNSDDLFPNEPWIAKTRDTLAKTGQAFQTVSYNTAHSGLLLSFLQMLGNRAEELSAQLSLRDKINFLYSLCSSPNYNIKSTEQWEKTEDIFKHFILHNIKKIEQAKTNAKKEKLVDELINRLMFSQTGFDSKIKTLTTVLGVLKQTKPLSMPVVLDDGSRADFFDLNKSKTYKIMHSLDVSKTKQDLDFSNLVVNGDFVCRYVSSRIVLPKSINGLLDLSGYKHLSTLTSLPNGTTDVVLKHSIKSFAELNKIKFPSSVSSVLVARSIINGATKNVEELKQIQIFATKYPDIEIWDDQQKLSLREALEKQQEALTSKKTPKQTSGVKQTKIQIEEKTDAWLTRKEVVDKLSSDPKFADVDDLERLVQRATNYNRGLAKNKLVDGQPVLCVNENDFNAVKSAAFQILQNDAKRIQVAQPEQPENTGKKRRKKKPSETSDESEKVKEVAQLEPIQIDKYISRGIWKDICNSCGNSPHLLINLLQSIDKVNMDYTKQPSSRSLQYIGENKTIQVVHNLRREDGCGLTQSIDNNTCGDRKRVVWTINVADKIIAAVGFFEQHAGTKKASVPYKLARIAAAKTQNTNGDYITREFVMERGYLKVSDLLEQLKKENSVADTEEPEEKIETVPENTENDATHTQVPVQDSVLPTEQEPQIVVDNIEDDVQPVVVDDAKHVVDNDIQPDTKNYVQPVVDKKGTTKKTKIVSNEGANHEHPHITRKSYKVRTLVDVKAIEAEINAILAAKDQEIKRLSIDMCKEKDNPQRQLKIAKLITQLILEKRELMGK